MNQISQQDIESERLEMASEKSTRKRGRVAFITTPKYRDATPWVIEDFVQRHMYSLCHSFEVLCTGRTYDFVTKVVNRPFDRMNRKIIAEDTRFPITTEQDLARWRSTVLAGLVEQQPGISGMIEIAYELVEGRVDAIIHFTDWEDVIGKADSMVLRREANVHNIPIASDIHTAESMVRAWSALLARTHASDPIFKVRPAPKVRPLEGLTLDHRIIALIAHDRMKLDLCCFVVEHAKTIFNNFDFVLATGTTGGWLKRFFDALGRGQEAAKKIRCCLSGPYGGDVQIAAAVVKKLCRKVIFLQDPLTSHAHDTDIRLFEQSVLLFQRAAVKQEIEIQLATNLEAAKLILEG